MPGAQASRASSSLPAWLPPRRPGRLPRRHATPPTLSHSLWISPLPLFSPPRAAADVARNHRGHSHFLAPSLRTRAQPGPQAPLRRPTEARMPQDDAAAFLPDHGHRMPPSDSPSPSPPRARRPSLRTHREPLSISPLSPCPSAPSIHPGCRSRQFLAAGDDADEARATVANSRARQHAQHSSRSRARPPVRPAVPPSANPDLAVLRPPPRSPPSPSPTSPARTDATIRCAHTPATRRAPQSPIWSPEEDFRPPPPSLAPPATSRGSTPAS